MENQFSRTEILIGQKKLEKLKKSYIAIFGLGGVGGYAAETLVRSGIGKIDLIDNDKISDSNINRQIFATNKTLGIYKTHAAKNRFLEINPDIKITTYEIFYSSDTSSLFDFSKYNYIIDAIDFVEGKIELAINADKAGTPIISSMGAGGKMNPCAFETSDIYKTSVCPLAKTMRRELKKYGIKKLKTVFSKEMPINHISEKKIEAVDKDNIFTKESHYKSRIIGSSPFVPPAAGLLIASEVVKDIIEWED